jgi:hypothetical protein
MAATGRSGCREEHGGHLQATHARPVPKKEAGALDRREKGRGPCSARASCVAATLAERKDESLGGRL